MMYRVTVTQSTVYEIDAYSRSQAERIAMDAAKAEMPPAFRLDMQAAAEPENETEEICQQR
jgi:hypothetical protein